MDSLSCFTLWADLFLYIFMEMDTLTLNINPAVVRVKMTLNCEDKGPVQNVRTAGRLRPPTQDD